MQAASAVAANVVKMFLARGYTAVSNESSDTALCVRARAGDAPVLATFVVGPTAAALRRAVTRELRTPPFLDADGAPVERWRVLAVFTADHTPRVVPPDLLASGRGAVEMWLAARLTRDHAAHRRVPRHELVPPHAVDAELARWGGRDARARLPLIAPTDPAARYLALVPGDVVRITRFEGARGEYPYYRLCADRALPPPPPPPPPAASTLRRQLHRRGRRRKRR